MNQKTCAFSGHRPQKYPWKYNEGDHRCMALKAVLAAEIKKLTEAGYSEFLSGMAEGADTWAARIVLKLRENNPALRLRCILPCKSQSDRWSEAARENYRRILQQADSVVFVQLEYSHSCMIERNRFLVDHADLLLAVYNGDRRSGTAATVRYAEKRGKKTIIIKPV